MPSVSDLAESSEHNRAVQEKLRQEFELPSNAVEIAVSSVKKATDFGVVFETKVTWSLLMEQLRKNPSTGKSELIVYKVPAQRDLPLSAAPYQLPE